MLGLMNTMLKGFFVLIMTSCCLNCILKFKIIQREVQDQNNILLKELKRNTYHGIYYIILFQLLTPKYFTLSSNGK